MVTQRRLVSPRERLEALAILHAREELADWHRKRGVLAAAFTAHGILRVRFSASGTWIQITERKQA